MTKAADKKLPTTGTKTEPNAVSAAGRFGGALFDIGWRLGITVIVFLWGGNALDEKFDTKPWFTVAGFLLIIVSFVLIVLQILRKIPRSQGGLEDVK